MVAVNRHNKGFDFFSHQPYLEKNTIYTHYRPQKEDMLNGIVWESYQADRFDSSKDIALPDICADIMILYTSDRAYTYFMGGTETARSMKDIDFIDDVKTIFGVKFCPGSLGNIFTEDLCDAAGSSIEAINVMYNGPSVTRALENAENFNDRIIVMQNYLANRLNDGYEVDMLSNYVTHRIMSTHGMLKINDLAEETGYTDRYLRKFMTRKLGMNMKTFSQIVQLQWSYHLSKECAVPCQNLADLAQLCGYYDQSHMNASYKKLTGMLPRDAFSLYE